jgi:putative FmdB family regulatory protein
MPTYDYICPNGHRFEVIHPVSAAGPDACPICGAAPVRKAFSAPTIHFKGSGWAKKDRSASSRSAARAAAGGSDATETAPSAAPASDGGGDGSSGTAAAPAPAKPVADKTGTGGERTKTADSSTAGGSAKGG